MKNHGRVSLKKFKGLQKCRGRTVILLLAGMICWGSLTVQAKEMDQVDRSAGKETVEKEQSNWEQMTRDLGESLDYSALDEVLEQASLPEDIRFGDVVTDLIEGKETAWGSILSYVRQLFFGQWQENKAFLIQVLLLVTGFALLKNFAEVFDKGYVAQVSFLLIYCLLMTLLMQSLFVLNDVTADTVNTVIDFMTAFIPVFATTMVLVTGNVTAAGFYQISFLVIYILQWILGYFLIPFVRIYVLVGLVNQAMEEAPFGKVAELLSDGVLWCLKVVTSLVLGLNIIKNAMAPFRDSAFRTAVSRSLSMIPGVGSALSAVSDLFLATGGIIRSSVGTAALVLLVMICAVPLMKLMGMTLLYKLLGAVAEPVADKRIFGALQIVSRASGMLLRILTTCIVMIFLTVAITGLYAGRIG